MDNSLRALCDAIKKIIAQLKPQTNQLSFLIITGKNKQGKSALLRQSTLSEIPIFSEEHAKLYFNQRGIILELGENWFSNSKTILQSTLKQLNRCSKYLKITGLILCIDINELLTSDPVQFSIQKNEHINILTKLGINLGYIVDLAIILTKMDTLAGFSEFYQNDHSADLSNPLGFSLDCANQTRKKIEVYNDQFNQLIEILGQQVITKMHPARSTIKRTLIREFPLQLTGLRSPIQSLIQGISPFVFNLHSIYFTSAEQGGVSIDRLNKKIHHEYSLIVQDTFPQANNFRAYFIDGALKTIQDQCSQEPQINKSTQKQLISLAISLAAVSLIYVGYHHYKTSILLDEVSKELLAFDTLNSQEKGKPQALYHLTSAAQKIELISSNSLSLPKVHQLKINLHQNAQNKMHNEFIPSITAELEQEITSPTNTPIVRYKALKIYLMLSQPEHFSANEVESWFKQHWHDQPSDKLNKQLALLRSTLDHRLQKIPVKQQIISDARNYLNALPSTYLYYSLAKEAFSSQKNLISLDGFNLATAELPVYFTKSGFQETIDRIPHISKILKSENWILERQDVSQLEEMITQAYCFDYATWWQTFMRKSQPLRYQDYQQGRKTTTLLAQANTFSKIATLIQQETQPELSKTNSLFNQYIANKFTDLNLMSLSSVKELNGRIAELGQFISTLSVINDGGKTAFTITKLRFASDNASDPVSLLFNQSKQLPEPFNSWSKQIAGDAWVMLIRDTRHYINDQWQTTVFQDFQKTIAKRYPFDSSQSNEIAIKDFNRFFSSHGLLNTFSEEYIKPFLDLSNAEWKPKAVNDFVLPISTEALDQIIRANIITNMFFPDHLDESKIDFSLQKINLDPVVSLLQLEIGSTKLTDTQSNESMTHFTWPQPNAKLSLDSIEGNHYELAEEGAWAIFKLLEKVNVLVDEQDSANLQILFEVNSNSGRYLLRTNNQINPFTPGILSGFTLNQNIV